MKVVSLFFILFLTFQTVYSQSNGKIEFTEIKIGSQIWADKNLSVTTFLNGDSIPEVKSLEEWKNAAANKLPAWCYYNNISSYETKYGRLYNWYAVNDPRGLAPKGWHVASLEEWQALKNFAGGDNEVATSKLKSKSGWAKRSKYSNEKAIDGNGNNAINFSALPGGFRNYEGEFEGESYRSFWWTSTQVAGWNGQTQAWAFGLSHPTIQSDWYINGDVKNSFLSVRCIQNVEKTDLNNKNNNRNENEKLGVMDIY